MVLKLSSLIVATIICISLESAVAYNTHLHDDRIEFPEGSHEHQAIQVEYFENGTTIATYPDGTRVVRPSATASSEQTEFSTRSTGKPSRVSSVPRFGPNTTMPTPKCLASDGTSIYCTKVQNYPRTLIENLLRTNSDTILFKSDKLDNELDMRFGGLPNDEPLCEFSDEVIYPESGITHDDVPFFIVNTQQQQGVRVERCLNPDQSCTSKISFPLRYKSVCRQNYVYRELISPSNDLTALEKRKFKFPSCCSCMLQRVLD